MSSVDVRGVTLDYPVYSVQGKSLRSAVLSAAVGGRMMKTEHDVTVVRALTNVSFSLQSGDRLGVVGHNGSGKTSLLKVLAGVYEPSQGLVNIQGRVSSMLSLSIGVDPEATGLQNMRTLIMMRNLSRKEIDRKLPEIIEFSELGHYIHMPFKTYSAGMMARLVFSVATAIEADVLFMDEWLGAGDANFRDKAADRMNGMVEKAGIVVLASHDVGLIRRVCNKVLILNGGRTEFLGSVEEWQELSQAA